MKFWESGLVASGLWLAAALLLAAALRRLLPPLQRLSIPDSMVAGLLGLVAGPSVLGLVPFDVAMLESIVYHGLALVFIALGLQTPAAASGEAPPGGGGARSFAFGIPFLAMLQGLIGLLLVLALSSGGDPQHPGLGLLLPLGFSQGPGQALSLGSAWEEGLGFASGGQIGLIFAALGFGWAVFIGAPLVALGRRMGWVDDPGRAPGVDQSLDTFETEPPTPSPGGLDPLTVQLVTVGVLYLVTYAIIDAATGALAGKPQIAALLWGFHFLVGSGIAMATRGLINRARGARPSPLHNGLLGRIASLTVDVVTAAALTAVQLQVLRAQWLPILLITTVGGLITGLISLWLARRAFPSAPFAHALVLFGTSTGTLSTGLALLRMIDPEFKGPVATNVVLGATGSILLGAPLLLVVLPIPTIGAFGLEGWPGGFPGNVWAACGALALYLVFLIAMWVKFGPLRGQGAPLSLWPRGRGEG